MAVFGPNAPRSSGTSPPGLRRHLLESLLVVTAYFVVGKLGLLVPFTSGNISPVWPAAGIALTAVLLFGPPIAPAVFVGALLVNFFSPIPHGAAIGVAIGNTLGPLAGVALLRQIPGFTRRLPGLRDVVALVLCGGLLGTALSATLGTAALRLSGVTAWSGFSSAWLVWWMGDCMGVLLVAPLLLTAPIKAPRRGLLEAVAIAIAGAAACIALFDPRLVGTTEEVLALALFPFVILAAMRVGIFGAALTTLCIAAAAVWETGSGIGPFVRSTPLHDSALLQTFLAVMSTTGMALAAVVGEREQLIAAQAAQAAVQESERLYRGIIETTNEGVWMVDADLRTVFVNPQMATMLGYLPVEMMGRRVFDFMFPEDVPHKQAEFDRRRHGEGAHLDSRYRRQDGSELWTRLSAAPIMDEHGRFRGALAMVTDMTEYRQAEHALRESEKLAVTGRLAATIAHEINNPLEAVTNLMYLAENADSLARARDYLAMGSAELNRVSAIAKHTLRFYRDASPPHLVDLADLTCQVVALYQSKIDAKGLAIEREIQGNVEIYGSDGELKQVITNLLLNAVEAVRLGGRLRVRVRALGGFAHLLVADNGSGIPAGHRAKLFKPFFTTGKAFGTGLGLWVTKGLIEKHSGRIRVCSNDIPGRSGTVFFVSVPLATNHSQTAIAA